MDDQEQEAIIQGVHDVVMAYTDNPQNIFDHFRNDTEFRSRVTTFINRGGTDICYCMIGGNRCSQCLINRIISRYLLEDKQLYIKDLLVLMTLINKKFP
jgi:hypothetical protein